MIRNFIFILLLSFALIPDALSESPNILFILADDQRPDTIGAHGNSLIETPNLDTLVDEGYSFRRNYCMGSMHGAVCQPSRAMMMTGQAYFRIPMDLQGVETFPQRLQDEGYKTFITGKWHNKQPGVVKSFQQGEAVMMGGMSNHEAVPIVDIGENDDLVNKRTGEAFSSTLFADAAIEFLEQQSDEQPFLAYVSLTSPHDPRQPPEKYREMYYEKELPMPANFLPQHPFDNGRLIVRDENLGGWPRTEPMVRDQLAEYYGMITHMDHQIGRIIETLEERGLRENTIIVYAADHGLAVGSHGLLGKQSVYEHSMGAPLIFAGPGVPKGESHSLTYLYDIFPTVFELIDIEVPDVDGNSLVPIWSGSTESVRDSIFLAYEDEQRAVIEDRWKLIRYPKIDHTQLFDLWDDPHETINLADDPAYGQLVERLMPQLAHLQEHFGDQAPLHTDSVRPKDIDLTGTPREPDRWQPDWIVEKYFEEE